MTKIADWDGDIDYETKKQSHTPDEQAEIFAKDTNAFHQMIREQYQAERLRKIRKAFEEHNHRRNIIRKKRKQQRQNRRRAR